MKSRAVLTLITAAVVLASFSLGGCSSSGDPTDPYGGGSGGGYPSFESGDLRAPATYVHIFPVAGTAPYYCRFHPMTGTVNVVAGAADSAVVTVSGMTFAPQLVSVRPGGSVRWNVIDDIHSVTSGTH